MAIQQGYQFGRFVEVEIKNFITQEKTVIPNDFEIDFEFTKTVDQVEQASVGVVRIYGLNDETIDRINSDGGEILLRCGYTNDQIKTLFVADILYINPYKSQGTSITEIHCSANVLTHMFGANLSVGQGKTTVMKLLTDVSKALGKKALVQGTNVPMESMNQYIELLKTWEIKVDLFGTAQQILEMICLNFSFEVVDTEMTDETTGVKTEGFVFVQKANGVADFLKKIEDGYPKISNSDASQDQFKKGEDIDAIFITPEKERAMAIVLHKKSGLKNISIGYKIATVAETQELAANETQTVKSQEKQAQRQAKEAERKEKYEKKVAEGKKVKPLQKKVGTIKVNRRVINFTALINPSLRPQGHVLIYTDDLKYRGIYIVREIKFAGNNKRGSWDMSCVAEDTTGRYDTRAKETAQVTDEPETVTGNVGDTTSYGSTE